MTGTDFVHETKAALDASRERAFRALTEPSELERWFATRAQIEPRVGGAYRFHGKATLGAPSERDADQKITALEKNSRLAYSWRVCGVDSEVDLSLHPAQGGADAGKCELRIRHAVKGPLPFDRPKHVIDDLWRMHVANLMAHLAGGDDVSLPDFTDPSPRVVVSIEIDAPPSRVFAALTDPKQIERWTVGCPTSGATVDIAKREYSYGWSYEVDGRKVKGGPTRILAFEQDRRLVTDWPDWREAPGQPVTQVEWKLEDLGGRTRLTLTHSGFAKPVDRSDYQQGWKGLLQQFREVIAS